MTSPGAPAAVTGLAIVGGGPAGMAAARLAVDHGADVTVIDEQPRVGGQILRQPPRGVEVTDWLPGAVYRNVRRTLAEIENDPSVDWRLRSSAVALLPQGNGHGVELWLDTPEGLQAVHAQTVLLAPGCHEQPLHFPGWTLPGVMGAGALQSFVKSQQLVPGRRFVLSGSHPLQLVVAEQLLRAGAEIAAVAFTQRPWAGLRLLATPMVALRAHRQLSAAAAAMWHLRAAGVPVLFGHSVVRARGEESVSAAVVAPVDADGHPDLRRAREFECDRIGVCHGFRVSSELARQAGARVAWSTRRGGWLVAHDAWYRSSVDRLHVAGEITGMAGADAALEEGRIAALGALRQIGAIDAAGAEALAGPVRRRLARLHRFADVLTRLSAPPGNLAAHLADDETLLCRCENVSVASFDRAVDDNAFIVTADAAKLLTRAGMGLCQGRLCGEQVARRLERRRGLATGAAGALHVNLPVRPVRLGAAVGDED